MTMKTQKQSFLAVSFLILFIFSCAKDKIIERPNIILIMADDMGYSDLGFFGSEIQTPNLDRLAENGLVMTQFYNTGRCTPTRAALLTGLYPHQVGTGHLTVDFGHPSYQGYINKDGITIAEALKREGYTTMMTGKWHLGDPEKSWPQNRGFEHFYGVPRGGGIYFYPFLIDREVMLNNEVVQVDSSFYSTDAFNDYSVQFIEEHHRKEENKPFFLYVAHIAPHFPLQAPEDDIAKYRGKFKEGFETYRQRRFELMLKQGILPENTQLSPSDERVKHWDNLSEAEQDTMDKKMAVYAAQMDVMDQGIGRIIDKLKDIGEYENTVIMYLSDNGAISTDLAGDAERRGIEGADGPIGSRYSWDAYEASWGNVSNTPFRLYKAWVHEGGIKTPLIIHWPRMIKNHRIDHQVGHVIDIMPTVLDAAGVDYPASYNDQEILPMEGESLIPVIKGRELNRENPLFWEHQGNRAIRKNEWKLVSEYPENKWHLYNLDEDLTEMNDLSNEYTNLVRELESEYQKWADRIGVIPWGEFD